MSKKLTRPEFYREIFRNPLLRSWIRDAWIHEQGITGGVVAVPGVGPHDVDLINDDDPDGTNPAIDEIHRRITSGQGRIRRRRLPPLTQASFKRMVLQLTRIMNLPSPEHLADLGLVATRQLPPME